MAYFIILPVWVLVLLGMAGAHGSDADGAALEPPLPLRLAGPAVVLGRLPVGQALLWLGVAAIVGAGRQADAERSGPAALQAALGLALILGPVVASMAGFGTGTVVALLLARRRASGSPP